MECLFNTTRQLINKTDSRFVRYIYSKTNWDNRTIGLTGPSGVGKVTMILQHIKNSLDITKTLYVSAEGFFFADNKLVDLAQRFFRYGGKYLFIDEIHKYKNGSRELKLIYDYHPELKVVFIGLPVLDIKMGASDLWETFFNQMRVNYEVIASKVADFEFNDVTFEVGGKNKSKKQIRNIENRFIIKDEIEYDFGNVVLLWQFGLLY